MLGISIKFNNLKARIFFFSILVPTLLVGFFVSINSAKAESVIISEDTTWTQGEVIVINGEEGLLISPDVILTIEEGVIIKLAENNSLFVQGNLDINGTAENPVIITSLKNDQIGGDTNGDGALSTPNPGDWGAIVVSNSNSNINIDYTNIEYSGGFSVGFNMYLGLMDADSVNINHSNIINNFGVAMVGSVNSINIENSNIYNPDFCQDVDGVEFCGSAILNTGGIEVQAINNYWGHTEGPTLDMSDAKGTFLQNFNQGSFIYEPFLTEETVFDDNKIKVAVILAETKDIKHASSSITAQPCKLIPEKTYQNGHNREYYEDLLYCVKDYHCENSFGEMNEQGECVGGLVNLEFQVYDNTGQWYKLNKNEVDYSGVQGAIDFFNETVALATSTEFNNKSEKDVVVAVHSGYSKQVDEKKVFETAVNKINEIIIAENDEIYFWAHEVAHLLGSLLIAGPDTTLLPDMYDNEGNVDRWCLMGKANENTDSNNPPLLSSYLREFLKWNSYDIHPRSDYGPHWIDSLEQMEEGDKIFRYNLDDSVSSSVEKYYIFEARNTSLGNWDSVLPENRVLLLYYIDEKGFDEYGYDNNGNSFNEKRNVGIPGNGNYFEGSMNNGVLIPNTDYEFLDFDNLLKVKAGSDRFYNDRYQIEVEIGEFDPSILQHIYYGVVFNADNTIRFLSKTAWETFGFKGGINNESQLFMDENGLLENSTERIIALRMGYLLGFLIFIVFGSIFIILHFKAFKNKGPRSIVKIGNLILMTISILVALNMLLLLLLSFSTKDDRDMEKYPNIFKFVFAAPSLTGTLKPDMDLHLYCNDGKHVGVNYETGEYEVDIPEAITIGDSQGSREWIFAPEEYKDDCHFVVSSYDNQKFLEQNPEIAEELGTSTAESYEIYARYIDPESGIYTSEELTQPLEPGMEVEHKILGETEIEISEGEVFDIVAPTTTMEIIGVEDGEGGYLSSVQIELSAEDNNSGVLKTEYSLDNGETWTLYEEPIVIDQDGEYTIIYSSTDRAGNREINKEQMISIQILSDIDLVILNIEKLYSDGEINKKAKKKLINRLEGIQKYTEKYGDRELKRSDKQEKTMDKCIDKHGQEFCENKLGKVFDRVNYKLNKIHERILKIRYKILLKQLKLHKRINWVSDYAYDIIREDINNLKNNI